MNIYAFVNQKGGVGKTTSCLNVAAGLAISGKNVLLIDMDPSGNLTAGSAIELGDEDFTVYEVLKGENGISDAIRPAWCSLFGKCDIIPADNLLSGLELELADIPGRQTLLRDAIRQVSTPYDYVLIDCPPSLNSLSVMALAAAQAVIVPVTPQYYSLYGVAQLLETIGIVKERMNPALEIGGILVTMYDQRKVSHRECIESLQKAFPGKVYHATIGNFVCLAEAPSHGQSIFEYSPKSKAAGQYRELVDEIIRLEAM